MAPSREPLPPAELPGAARYRQEAPARREPGSTPPKEPPVPPALAPTSRPDHSVCRIWHRWRAAPRMPCTTTCPRGAVAHFLLLPRRLDRIGYGRHGPGHTVDTSCIFPWWRTRHAAACHAQWLFAIADEMTRVEISTHERCPHGYTKRPLRASFPVEAALAASSSGPCRGPCMSPMANGDKPSPSRRSARMLTNTGGSVQAIVH